MKILCFGDSNTYGYDPRSCLGEQYSADIRWSGRLAQENDFEIIEAGQNGREIPHSAYSLQQLQRLIYHFSPDLFLIMLGTNDLLCGCSVEEAVTRMEQALCFLDTDRILLIAPPPLQLGDWVPDDKLIDKSNLLSAAYRELAHRLHVCFADAGEWHIELLYDGVHFSEAGHRAFAENLSALLKKDFG